MTRPPKGAGRTYSDVGILTTHDRLLHVSAEMFAEEGFEKVTVRDIASQLGMTTGAVYMHFRNKAELLAATVDLRISEMLEKGGTRQRSRPLCR